MDIAFLPLDEADLPRLHRWLNNPAVSEWYGLGLQNATAPTLAQVVEHYGPRINGGSSTVPYIITGAGKPIGYIQCYRLGDYPPYASTLGLDDDAWGIDLFIGEDGARGGGTGASVVREFVERVIFSRPGVETAVIAPHPDNKRAVRCYENAGFRYEKTVFVPESNEQEYVMTQRRPE